MSEDTPRYLARAPRAAGERSDRRERGERQETPPLKEARVDGTHRTYFIDLRENERGPYVKLKARSGGKVDIVMIPGEVLQEIVDHLQDMADIVEGRRSA